jgi:choline dehydrogenase-like flavoprotein
MQTEDLRNLAHNTIIETDLCIVGSGPAGLSIAKEFAGSNLQVWVLESGGMTEEADTQSLYKIENVGDPRRIEQDRIRSRIYGGTSRLWTGRCAPFSEEDYQRRAWIPYSGWPFDHTEVEPYLERAGENLGLGPNCYDERLWEQFKTAAPRKRPNANLLQPTYWQFSRGRKNPKEPSRFHRDIDLANAENIHVLLHANVTHLNTDAQGRQVESVEVSTLEHKKALVKAKAVVLACGGVENARLLLASNRIVPHGVGNQNDMVGRFLMDHPLCTIGLFDEKTSQEVRDCFGQYWLDRGKNRHVYLYGLSLSHHVQKKERLLRCDAFIEDQVATQGNYWAAIRRLKQALQHKKIDLKTYEDAMLALSSSWSISKDLHRRFVKHRPPLVKPERIELNCMLEQLPNPNSRVTLSPDQTDRLGMPLSRLDWKMDELELKTLQRMSQLTSQEFQRLGFPQPTVPEWLIQGDNWKRHATDKSHHTGTTRISANPSEGVVDENCQVHGVDNLFIAGSSVFSTVGTANPTLMIVALSIRLADWLQENQFRDRAVVLDQTSQLATVGVVQ